MAHKAASCENVGVETTLKQEAKDGSQYYRFGETVQAGLDAGTRTGAGTDFCSILGWLGWSGIFWRSTVEFVEI